MPEPNVDTTQAQNFLADAPWFEVGIIAFLYACMAGFALFVLAGTLFQNWRDIRKLPPAEARLARRNIRQKWWRNVFRRELLGLIVLHLLPLAGVVFLNWRVGDVIIIYTLEMVAVAFMQSLFICISIVQTNWSYRKSTPSASPARWRRAMRIMFEILLASTSLLIVGFVGLMVLIGPILLADVFGLEFDLSLGMLAVTLLLAMPHLVSLFFMSPRKNLEKMIDYRLAIAGKLANVWAFTMLAILPAMYSCALLAAHLQSFVLIALPITLLTLIFDIVRLPRLDHA